MISEPALINIALQRIKDAKVLFEKRRYHSSFYLAGYEIEFALKNKICKMYFFTQGYPETTIELQLYFKLINNKRVRGIISKIQQIKHHVFAKLLVYPGE